MRPIVSMKMRRLTIKAMFPYGFESQLNLKVFIHIIVRIFDVKAQPTHFHGYNHAHPTLLRPFQKISLREQAAMSHHSVGSRVRWIKMDEGGCDSFDKIQLSPVADNPHLIH